MLNKRQSINQLTNQSESLTAGNTWYTARVDNQQNR